MPVKTMAMPCSSAAAITSASRFEPPAAPPFVSRPEPIAVENPIVAEHEEIRRFLERTLGG